MARTYEGMPMWMQRAADALNGRRCGACDELQVDCQCPRDDLSVPCTVDTSCEEGFHTYTWPCDYAPGTGRLT